MWLKRLIEADRFLLLLILVVLLASFLPSQGIAKTIFDILTVVAIALLFFLHGAKLSSQAIIEGFSHWRLHLLILSSTFILFPVLGLALHFFVPAIIPNNIYLGVLYLCVLPATVQSAIAYTSIAGGNVAAAICSASASSILGVFLSPALVGILLHSYGEQNMLKAIMGIVLQLIVPFLAGHFSRRWLKTWIERNRIWLKSVDQGSILLVVYTAFSAAVAEGLWHKVNVLTFVQLIVISMVLLFVVLILNTLAARLFKFSREDEIAIVFCGSKKSLANGLPMANLLFPAATVGIMILPLMIFHQLQLFVCAWLARQYARRR